MEPTKGANAPRVVLASASPRRRELLRSLVSDFDIAPADIDEDAISLASPEETAMAIALAKALKIAESRTECLVIGADTVVALSESPAPGDAIRPVYELLGKPLDEEDGIRMLAALSGRSHLVVTGVALVHGRAMHSFFDRTAVLFRTLGREEITAYVRTGEPMDKAGGYAIQGGASKFVAQVDGSLSNVVGLPMEALERELRHFSGGIGSDREV